MNSDQELALLSHEHYRSAREHASNCRIESACVVDPESPHDVCTTVINTLLETTPRSFAEFLSRCDSPERLENEDMCPHEITAKG